jgi:hypothetical protein
VPGTSVAGDALLVSTGNGASAGSGASPLAIAAGFVAIFDGAAAFGGGAHDVSATAKTNADDPRDARVVATRAAEFR